MRMILIGYLTVFCLSVVVRLALERLNIRHLKRHGHAVPAGFQGAIDTETLVRMRDYTVARSRVGLLEDLVADALILVVLFSGLVAWLNGGILRWDAPFILSGLAFFLAIALCLGIPGIPFDLYRTFVIERRFGFSTITLRLWLMDLLKTTVLSLILGGIILGALLALIEAAPATWWIWMWGVYAVLQLLIIVLYPLLIAPLFNRFVPLEDPAIKAGVEALAHKAGLKVKGLYVIDAGKRSRHSNAYFTGLGRSKRIVLFDTLLGTHAPEEVLAVLAHEIGHWRKGHIPKQLLVSLLVTLGLLYGAGLLLNWPPLYAAFGIAPPTVYVGLTLLGLVAKPVFFLLGPLGNGMTRRFELQADDYGAALVGSARPLVQALERLAKDNLANLHPHPLYAWFYFTHPPLAARVARLRRP